MKRYCGRDFSEKELEVIRNLIAEDPNRNRAQLSRLTCQALHWYKPDGGLKEMSARVAMLRMQEDGLIQLPAPRRKRPRPCITLSFKSDPQAKILQAVHALGELKLKLVKSRAESKLWNEYIQRYHYLGYKTLPGAQLRYFIKRGESNLALLGFGAAAWQTAPRDKFIAWSHDQRKKNLHLIVNNARFLILPWVRSKNLASKILAMVARQLPDHWHQRYGYRPVLMETFVQTNRFSGTCYRAANWKHVGQTKGRGKLGPAGKISVPIKDVWLYPLIKHFRSALI